MICSGEKVAVASLSSQDGNWRLSQIIEHKWFRREVMTVEGKAGKWLSAEKEDIIFQCL